MNIHLFLTEHGYLNHHPDSINKEVMVYYKKVPNTIRHQLIVKEWPPIQRMTGRYAKHSYEVEMCYETESGIWAATKFYGLDAENLMKSLPALEKRLVESIVPMGANPKHYEYDGRD